MTGPFLRSLIVWIYGSLLMIPSVALAYLLAPFMGGRRAFWAIAPSYLRHFGRCFGVRSRLEGFEDLPEEIRDGRQPAVFIANHASLLDPPLLIAFLPCRPVFVAKRELAKVPVLGWIIWLAGFIFIDRRNHTRSMRSIEAAARRIHDGQSIIAFPEGTRSLDGRLLPFKKGPFHMAIQAGVPVVPMGIVGAREVLPKFAWRVGQADYVVHIGQPILVSAETDVDTLRSQSAAAVAALLRIEQIQ